MTLDISPATEPAPVGDVRTIRRIGVEEELLLVDARTLVPVPVADDVIRRAATLRPRAGTSVEHEVKREQIEIVSPPLSTLDELSAAIVRGRRIADEAARDAGARAVALATAPLRSETHPVSEPRYDRMSERFGLTMIEQLTCGFHVHVEIASREEGVAILDRIRPWLPVLLALSANSPFWQGVDTDFASYRYQAWGRWPTAGPYDRFGSASGYDETLDQILAADVSFDLGMIYFDARLSRHAPTVEVRIADVCLHPDDAATLAALTRALAETAAAAWRAGTPADAVPTRVLRLATWRASRFGLTQELLHPGTATRCSAAVAVHALLKHVDDGFASEAERSRVWSGVSTILHRGTGAAHQRRALSVRDERRDVVADALRRTHATEG